MGGRGASSKRGTGGAGGGSSDGVIMSNKPVTIETDYRTRGNGAYGEYRNEVLEAKTDGSGNVTFNWASATSFDKESKNPVRLHSN